VNQTTDGQGTDILRYWLLVRSRLWLVIALAVVVTVLVGVIVKDMPTVYKATVTMLLSPEQAKAISMQDMFADNVGSRTYFNTQLGIIQSRSILEQLISEMDMVHSPEFVSSKPSKLTWLKSILKLDRASQKPSEEEIKRSVLESIRGNITVANPVYTKFIKLSYESSSAMMAAKVANTLADIYITDSLDSRVQMAHQATDWMRQRADSLRQKLSQAEGRLQSFIDKKGLVNTGEGVTSLTSQELTALTESSLQARARVSELSQRYGSKHPKLIAARAELARAQAALNRSKSKIRMLGKQDVQLKALQHEVDSTRKLYETILNRLKETDQASTLITAAARVVDPAVVPLKHEKSKKKLIVVAAFVLTLAAGIGLILLLDMLDSTIHSIKDVEDRLGMPMLGLLPLLTFKSKDVEKKLDEMVHGGHHQFAEAIRTIRTGVMLSAIDNPHKVILVTSSMPGEGKSTVAANLAIAMGKLERVLLLDADLRRPTVGKHFGMNTKEKGVSELAAGTSTFKDCLERNETYNIDVMHAGTVPPNPLELLSSNRFKAVLKSLENHYDRIIIDSTPVQAVSDALIMSQYARGVLYVIKADATPDRVIKNCFKRLREVDAPVIGVVLNQVDIKKSARYGYEDYEGYYDHYGYSAASDKA